MRYIVKAGTYTIKYSNKCKHVLLRCLPQIHSVLIKLTLTTITTSTTMIMTIIITTFYRAVLSYLKTQ